MGFLFHPVVVSECIRVQDVKSLDKKLPEVGLQLQAARRTEEM